MTKKTAQKIPSILIVDDESETVQDELDLVAEEGDPQFEAAVVHPRDLQADHLSNAHLILVDYHLDKWPERDSSSSLAMKPETGLSLAMVVRDHLDLNDATGSTAIALHTGFLGEIRGAGLAASSACHVVARLNNLEWIFEKLDPKRFKKMILLANAVRQLPSVWPPSAKKAIGETRRLLDINEGDRSFDRCWRDVRECQVPVHELTSKGHKIQFVRWLLHQILPYPTFLRDKHWVAARLEITVESLEAVLADSESQLADDLSSIRYTGVLSGFLGDRWWRGALEDYAWELVEGGIGGRKRLHDALNERSRTRLARTVSNPIVSLNTDLQPESEFSTPSEAVRLRPDHWPAFADFAWMNTKTLGYDGTLSAMVDPLDIGRIDGESDE